ncbi:MAG: nucleotidyltransferase domain-containing protein [Bacteroidota bacterium]
MSILELVKAKVGQFDQNADVILFGSRAKGTARKESDWDFLILMSQPVDYEMEDQIRDELYEIELEKEEIISSIVESSEDWEKYVITALYKNIDREGIIV